jgi:uncharacterized membrane protein YdbT with pleckstrin-like domain
MTTRFIEKNLVPGERLVYRTQPHWIVFSRAFLLTMVAILYVGFFPGDTSLIYFVMPVILLIWVANFIDYTCSEYAVTDKRVLVKVGFFQVEIVDTQLQRIESIQVSQNLLGKILNYGTITVRGTGGDAYPFAWIQKPLVFRSQAQEQMSHLGTA